MKRIIPLFAVALLWACDGSNTDAPNDGASAGAPVEPVLDSKSDLADRVDIKADLDFDQVTEFNAQFNEDFEFHGYRFQASKDAKVTLEVTQRGTSRGLNTTLFIYGP